MIPVTRPHLPARERVKRYIDGIYERQWLTNNGELVQELTRRLEDYLGVENLLLVANGTVALQVAYRALGLSRPTEGERREAITTPFTFVATASSLKWEGVDPVFSDIDPATWCVAPSEIEQHITDRTRAIVPVHVFGNPCDVEAIQRIAEKHRLKVIYDAAHAFGVRYKGESILKWGDAATLSFHATKVFHTAEGGAIIFKRREDLELARRLINFAITGPESIEGLGINAKMSELHAAMGLCVLDDIDDVIAQRHEVWKQYGHALAGSVRFQKRHPDATNNFGYAPVLLESEQQVTGLLNRLTEVNVKARRYFYPSLHTVSEYRTAQPMTTSRYIAERILCLPIYGGLPSNDMRTIVHTLISQLSK